MEELPEMLERILTMHSPLQKVEQAEELQQQVWGRGLNDQGRGLANQGRGQTDQGERFLYVT